MQGRVAIVTGAGRGLSHAFAKRFAKEGSTAIIAEIDRGRAESVAEEIIGSGGMLFRYKQISPMKIQLAQ
jgi:NAD(P)-dependent dehydrogenase (short-subunit alcohol dehydrogenase family)